MLRMDIGIWQATIFCEVILLAGLLYRTWILWMLPCFTSAILFSTVESVPLASLIHHYGRASREYFLAFYGFDLINVLLYLMSIRECWRKGYFASISMSMGLYLSFKAFGYILILAHCNRAAMLLAGDMRFANIACYVFWIVLVWGYDVFGIQSSTAEESSWDRTKN